MVKNGTRRKLKNPIRLIWKRNFFFNIIIFLAILWNMSSQRTQSDESRVKAASEDSQPINFTNFKPIMLRYGEEMKIRNKMYIRSLALKLKEVLDDNWNYDFPYFSIYSHFFHIWTGQNQATPLAIKRNKIRKPIKKIKVHELHLFSFNLNTSSHAIYKKKSSFSLSGGEKGKKLFGWGNYVTRIICWKCYDLILKKYQD